MSITSFLWSPQTGLTDQGIVNILITIVNIVIMMILHRKVYDELFPSVPALPGVAKLVHHLARNQVQPHHHLDDDQHNDHHNNNDDQHRHNKDDDHQIKTAVATSSSSHSFELKTSNHSGLFSLFDKLVIVDHYQ